MFFHLKKVIFSHKFGVLFRNKTALDNVLEGLTIARKNSPEEAKKKAMEMLEKVGMADRANFYPDQLPVVSSSVWLSQEPSPTIRK